MGSESGIDAGSFDLGSTFEGWTTKEIGAFLGPRDLCFARAVHGLQESLAFLEADSVRALPRKPKSDSSVLGG